MVEAASQEEKLAWLAALSAHTHYVESSLRVAAQVENRVNSATPAHSASNNSGTSTALVAADPTPGNLGSSVVLGAANHTSSTGTATATTPVLNSALTATNDPKQWMVYVDAAKLETIILCGVVNKPNPVGKAMIRELILTSRKRLIYIDSKSLEQKGEIDWNTNSGVEHFVKLVSASFNQRHVHNYIMDLLLPLVYFYF